MVGSGGGVGNLVATELSGDVGNDGSVNGDEINGIGDSNPCRGDVNRGSVVGNLISVSDWGVGRCRGLDGKDGEVGGGGGVGNLSIAIDDEGEVGGGGGVGNLSVMVDCEVDDVGNLNNSGMGGGVGNFAATMLKYLGVASTW